MNSRIIFAGCDGRYWPELVAERGFQHFFCRGNHAGIIDHGLDALGDRDHGLRRIRHGGDRLRCPLDTSEHLGAHLRLEAAHGARQHHFVGNDVFRGAAVDRTDADNAKFGRILFAADHTLNIDDKARGHHHGVNSCMRRRPVTATAAEFDVEAVVVRGACPDGIEHGAKAKAPLACKAKPKSGFGNRVNRPSISIAMAPAPTSSAGWAMNISVPLHRSFRPSSVFAVPTQLAMWMSWPQLWATNTSRPFQLVLSRLA